MFGFIAQRYLGDVWPLLVLAAGIGLAATARMLHDASTRTRAVVVGLLLVVGLGATWITFAQALWYQRVFASPSDEVATNEFFDTRTELGRLPAGSQTAVSRGDALPASGKAGEVFVVGDCAGVYVSDGSIVDEFSRTNWKPIERTPAAGAYDVDVTFPDAKAGTDDPLLVGGSPANPYVLRVEYLGDDMVRFRDDHNPGGGTTPAVHITPGRTYRIRVSADPNTQLSAVHLDDRTVFSGVYLGPDAPRLGVNNVDTLDRPRVPRHAQPASGVNRVVPPPRRPLRPPQASSSTCCSSNRS